jgi:hypothetical protein
MYEWGVMKRTVEAVQAGQRPAKIVALGAAMTRMALVTFPASGLYEPEQLKDRPLAVSPYNGSHFTTLKMLEGFIEKSHIKVTHAGTMVERIAAVRRGEVAAANVMEPWISVVQKQGFRVLMESNSTRAEAARDDLDGPTLAALFRARAAALINHDPAHYAHYFVAEAQGLLEPQELQTWRLLYGPRHRIRVSASRILTGGCKAIPTWSPQARPMTRWSIIARGSRLPRVGAGTAPAELGFGYARARIAKYTAFLHRHLGSADTASRQRAAPPLRRCTGWLPR